MAYTFQHGGPALASNDFDLAFDLQVSWAGRWISLNDHFNFRVGAEGWGIQDQTHRRRTITSDYFEGDFDLNAVRANSKRTVAVYVYGDDAIELRENLLRLLDYMSQDEFLLKQLVNDSVEIWSCDKADYSVDRSHAMLHANIAKVTFQVSTRPNITDGIDV